MKENIFSLVRNQTKLNIIEGVIRNMFFADDEMREKIKTILVEVVKLSNDIDQKISEMQNETDK